MPLGSANNRATAALLDDIFSEYANIATVPLTIDWGNEEHKERRSSLSSELSASSSCSSKIKYNTDKDLPLPPFVNDRDLIPAIMGRKGFGKDTTTRESSPLRSEIKRTNVRDSTDSEESLWFRSSAGYEIPPLRTMSPLSIPKKVRHPFETQSSGYDTPVRTSSAESLWNGSTDTWLTARSRIRIFMHEASGTPLEIHVGPLYEVVSFVWDTMTHPHNINLFTTLFSEYAVPRDSVINLIASRSMPLDHFLKSTELNIHVNPPQKPRYNGLDTLEITLNAEFVNLLNTTPESNAQSVKGLLRAAMIQQIGDYIYNHILIANGLEVLISPSLDITRVKEMKGGSITIHEIFGGAITYRWKKRRMEVLFRKANEVYRIPERTLVDMYRNIKVNPFEIDELDL